jgi:hypothetical protein
VKTVLAALDTAADDLRDQAETCTHCPDQSCTACQSRLHAAQAYDQIACRMLRPAPPAPAAGRRQPEPPGPVRHPGPADGKGGRPVTTHDTAPEDPGGRRPGDPRVPALRLSPEDLLELHEPYDLPDPYCDIRPPAPAPERDRDRPAPRLAARRTPLPGRAPGIHPRPPTRTRLGSRTVTPTRKAPP